MRYDESHGPTTHHVLNWQQNGVTYSLVEVTMSGEQCVEWITADSLVQEVVLRHPQAIAIFSRHGLNCAGCYVSPFHTIADTAREYAMAIDLLLGDLNRAITAEAGSLSAEQP
jgi:hybrid cluster-associated redox disulfide protein